MTTRRTLAAALLLLSLSAAALADNLRIATWNVTTFDPGDTRAAYHSPHHLAEGGTGPGDRYLPLLPTRRERGAPAL